MEDIAENPYTGKQNLRATRTLLELAESAEKRESKEAKRAGFKGSEETEAGGGTTYKRQDEQERRHVCEEKRHRQSGSHASDRDTHRRPSLSVRREGLRVMLCTERPLILLIYRNSPSTLFSKKNKYMYTLSK